MTSGSALFVAGICLSLQIVSFLEQSLVQLSFGPPGPSRHPMLDRIQNPSVLDRVGFQVLHGLLEGHCFARLCQLLKSKFLKFLTGREQVSYKASETVQAQRLPLG